MKVDINLLPPEHRPKPWALPLTIGLAVVIVAAGYYGWGFYDRKAAANSQLQELKTRLAATNAEITKVQADPTKKNLQQSITEAQAKINSLKAMELDYEKYYSGRIYWKPALQVVRELAPTDIKFTAFETNEDELTVEGELSSDVTDAVIIVEFAQELEKRGIFSRIAFEIGTDEREETVGTTTETREVFVFTMLLEVPPGGKK